MTKTIYNVHTYREMRLYFPGIAADTPAEAAKIAAGRSAAEADSTEDCDDENLTALVEVAGDDLSAHFASHRQIAVIWDIEDVLDIRPDLTRDQAWAVLESANSNHDANHGISWDTLEAAAIKLFGDAFDSDNE